MIRKSYVDTSKGQIHYRCIGDGQPIILLQLLPFGGAMFEPVMPALADRGYKCYALDLMGYGRSDKRRTDWRVEDYADNLIEAFGALGVEPKFVVAGHLSAIIAVDMALRSSSNVSKLVLDGVPCWNEAERKHMLTLVPQPDSLNSEGNLITNAWAVATGLLSQLDPSETPGPATENKFLDRYIAFLETIYKPGATAAIFGYPMDERLAKLSQQALIVTSPTDTLSSHHDKVVNIVPNCVKHSFSTTHPLYQMAPHVSEESIDEYVDLLHAFFEG